MFDTLRRELQAVVDGSTFCIYAVVLGIVVAAFGHIVVTLAQGLSVKISDVVYIIFFLILPLNSLREDTVRMFAKGLAFTLSALLIAAYLWDVWMLLACMLGLILGLYRPLHGCRANSYYWL